MTSLTLFTADPIRSALLEQLRDAPVFQTVLCVGSVEECCPKSPAVRTDAIIFDLSLTTPARAQDLMAAMEVADYAPALLFYEVREDGSIRYALSVADELPLSAELEADFTAALTPDFVCSRWYFRAAPWPEENIQYVFSEHSMALCELMHGVSEKEAQYYVGRYGLNLREAGYYAYYWELNYTLFTDHYRYKDIYHFVGFCLQQACYRILEKYNGGEAFYISLTQFCVIINDFRLSSETQNRRRLNALLAELLAVSSSARAAHYISKSFRSLRDFRAVYDTYLAERRMTFFCGSDQLFDATASHRELAEVDPKEINDALDIITKYLTYDVNNMELDQTLRRLFFDLLKPARDFSMYSYAASVLASKLMQADPAFDRRLVSHRLDINYLRHSTIDAEYRVFCSAIEKVRRQVGSGKQSKNALMMKTMDFIRKNYRDNILVSDIASALYISETYLSRICKTLTGKSVIQHLIDYRIAQAKTALAEEDVAIYAIAEQCGFRDVRHFSKTFKKMTGMSPTEYRRGHF